MHSKKLMLGVSAILGVMLLAPAAFAAVTQFSVSPTNVPTNGTVTISICTTTKTIVQQVLVTTPDGLVWKYVHPDIALYPSYVCPTTVDITFGGNTANWCLVSPPPANQDAGKCLSPQPSATETGVSGVYTAQVIYKSGQHGTEEFHVFVPFTVPEFGLPGAAVAALGFLTVASLAKYKFRRIP
ncbi:MAG: hypothetical protein ABSB29_06750 [Nitrososphaerales archaeon]|jgi:hypothetical protein